MADQEVGHAQLLTDMLGPAAPVQCEYEYPFTTVREFVDFCQKLTRFGESGVYGFLNHLDSRPAAQLLLQSISTEARQQMIFRQFDGLFPMPVWFETGIPQSWAWTLLAPYVKSCPANQTRLYWQNYPALTIVNNPNPARENNFLVGANETASNITVEESCGEACGPAITHNKTIPLSYPGRKVEFAWENPGKAVGPNDTYTTANGGEAKSPKFVIWVSQLNATYTPLTLTGSNAGYTIQPNGSVFATDPIVNGTMFVALTSTDLYVTPFNLSMVNPFTFAGPALYQSG
jgi:Ferritin-like domain